MADGRSKRVGGVVGDRRTSGLEPGGAEAVARHFARAMVARDAAAAAACFAAGAHILTADGTEIGGREDILAVLSQITGSDHELEIRSGRIIVAEGIGSCTQFWSRRATGAEHEQDSVARLILARIGSSWQIVIASPWEGW